MLIGGGIGDIAVSMNRVAIGAALLISVYRSTQCGSTIELTILCTLGEEIFAGRKFRVFRELWLNLRK